MSKIAITFFFSILTVVTNLYFVIVYVLKFLPFSLISLVKMCLDTGFVYTDFVKATINHIGCTFKTDLKKKINRIENN